jgi:hypothetical protein
MPRPHKNQRQAKVVMRITPRPEDMDRLRAKGMAEAVPVTTTQTPQRVDRISSHHPNPTTLEAWLSNPANAPRITLASAVADLDPKGPIYHRATTAEVAAPPCSEVAQPWPGDICPRRWVGRLQGAGQQPCGQSLRLLSAGQ